MPETEYYCKDYNCIVKESPCPYCGSYQHKKLASQ